MKVFLSWSGARSQATAKLLERWVKCVIQASRPWISTSGIGQGSVWFTAINDELKDTSVGIICLTHQNKEAPWILFEAGALSKGLQTAKVCTFLVDLETKHIRDPLAQFNHTTANKADMRRLANTLNGESVNPLDQLTLDAVFEAFWPDFERDFQAILEKYPQEAEVKLPSDQDMLSQILEGVRGISHRVRRLEDSQESTAYEQAGLRWGTTLAPHMVTPEALEKLTLEQLEKLMDASIAGDNVDLLFRVSKLIDEKKRVRVRLRDLKDKLAKQNPGPSN